MIGTSQKHCYIADKINVDIKTSEQRCCSVDNVIIKTLEQSFKMIHKLMLSMQPLS